MIKQQKSKKPDLENHKNTEKKLNIKNDSDNVLPSIPGYEDLSNGE